MCTISIGLFVLFSNYLDTTIDEVDKIYMGVAVDASRMAIMERL